MPSTPRTQLGQWATGRGDSSTVTTEQKHARRSIYSSAESLVARSDDRPEVAVREFHLAKPA
jgi:hypothetical protein